MMSELLLHFPYLLPECTLRCSPDVLQANLEETSPFFICLSGCAEQLPSRVYGTYLGYIILIEGPTLYLVFPVIIISVMFTF